MENYFNEFRLRVSNLQGFIILSTRKTEIHTYNYMIHLISNYSKNSLNICLKFNVK